MTALSNLPVVGEPTTTWVILDPDGHDARARARTIESLRDQTDRSWRVWEPDASSDGGTTAPAEVFGSAVTRASSEFVGVLDSGDRLTPDCVELLHAALAADPSAALVYADETIGGGRTNKPVWSPERLRHHNYIGRVWLARTADVRRHLADLGSHSAWEHDLFLLLGEHRPVVRVRAPLCVRRPQVDDPAGDARLDDTTAAVQRHLDRVDPTLRAEAHVDARAVSIVRPLSDELTVNVVIPTGWVASAEHPDRPLVLDAVRDLLANTKHPSVSVSVVYDEPVPAGALDELKATAGEKLSLIRYPKPFNFSEKCNLGAVSDTSAVIVLYNDDVVPAGPGWLEALVAPLGDPGVGVTGAKLRFPDGRIQSGGHRYYRTPETPSPVDGFRLTAGDEAGEQNVLLVDREVSGVTGACLAVRRDVFDAVGGLSEALPHNYNDVDFCLKVRRAGWRILWIAGCEMIHFESQTRVPNVRSWEHDVLRERWGGFVADAYLP